MDADVEMPEPISIARNVRGDGKHGNAAAMTIKETVDEMQIATMQLPHRRLSFQ